MLCQLTHQNVALEGVHLPPISNEAPKQGTRRFTDPDQRYLSELSVFLSESVVSLRYSGIFVNSSTCSMAFS